MTDIVERLRNATQFMDLDELAHEAADEIERLRKQLYRSDWADSADRALMQEEIDHLRDALERMRHDRDLILEMHERIRR